MQLTNLYRYPVKSLRGQALDTAHVETIGLRGDRRWLVTDLQGSFLTIRQLPRMVQIIAEVTATGLRLGHPDHGTCDVVFPDPSAPPVTARVWRDAVRGLKASGEASEFLSGVLGRQAQLVHLADPLVRRVDPLFGDEGDRVSFADGFPMLLASTSSLDDLGARMGRQISMRRFRPNLVIAGADPWAEDTWREIRIGAVGFRVVKPCGRCIVTTRDPDTGDEIEGGEPLRTLGKFHRAADGEIIFGQNLIPDGTGEIRVGERVEVLKWGRSNLLAD